MFINHGLVIVTYHPLKTFDSVAKFKRPILQILQAWLYDETIRKQLVAQSLMWSRNKDPKTAEADIVNKINYISDMYEQIGKQLTKLTPSIMNILKQALIKFSILIVPINRLKDIWILSLKRMLSHLVKVKTLIQSSTLLLSLLTLRRTATLRLIQ